MCLLKTFVYLYYSDQSKTIGMHLLKNDELVTKIVLFGVFSILISRLSMGFIYRRFGFHNMIAFNSVMSLITSFVPLVSGNSKLGFIIFMNFQRFSSGKAK